MCGSVEVHAWSLDLIVGEKPNENSLLGFNIGWNEHKNHRGPFWVEVPKPESGDVYYRLVFQGDDPESALVGVVCTDEEGQSGDQEAEWAYEGNLRDK